jgi:hypothetical protein
MSWIGSVVKGGVRYGVKYGPQAKILWDNGGKHAQAVAREKVEAASARRTAFQKAETVANGSVLKQIDDGKPVWVVYAGDVPALAKLVEHADLGARVTPEAYRAHQLRQRARRARARLRRRRAAGRDAAGRLDEKVGEVQE